MTKTPGVEIKITQIRLLEAKLWGIIYILWPYRIYGN